MSEELKNVTLAANDMARDIERLKARIAELERLIDAMCAALNGHECPDPSEGPMQTVTRAAVRLMEAERQVAALEKDSATLAALEAAGVDNWEGYSNAFAGDES